MPSFASSPCTRGAPQRGLALLMFRISSRISGATPGRPGLRRRLFQVQYRLNPVLSKNTNELKTDAPGRFDRHQPVASPRSGACRRRCRRFGFSARAGKTPSSNGMLRSLGEDLDPGPGQRWTLRRPGPHLDQNVLSQLRGSSPGLDSEPLGRRPLSPPPVWPGQRPLPNLAQTWHSKIEIRDPYRK